MGHSAGRRRSLGVAVISRLLSDMIGWAGFVAGNWLRGVAGGPGNLVAVVVQAGPPIRPQRRCGPSRIQPARTSLYGRVPLPPCTVGSAHQLCRRASRGSRRASGRLSTSVKSARSRARRTSSRYASLAGSSFAALEVVENQTGGFQLGRRQATGVQHGQGRQAADREHGAALLLPCSDPPERHEAQRAVGPDGERRFPFLALSQEVGPPPASDGLFRGEAGGQALRVDSKVAAEVKARSRGLPEVVRTGLETFADNALAVGFDDQVALSRGGVPPEHGVERAVPQRHDVERPLGACRRRCGPQCRGRPCPAFPVRSGRWLERSDAGWCAATPVCRPATRASRRPAPVPGAAAHPPSAKGARTNVPMSSSPTKMRPLRRSSGIRLAAPARAAASARLRGRRSRFTNSVSPQGASGSRFFVPTTSASAMPVSAENARSVLPLAAIDTTVKSL